MDGDWRGGRALPDTHLSRKERGEDGAPRFYASARMGAGSQGRVMEKVVPWLGP